MAMDCFNIGPAITMYKASAFMGFTVSLLTDDISYANIAVSGIAIYDIGGPIVSQHNLLFKYLPLTESTTYILLALAEPSHGYAVMQKVADISQGTVEVGPGTLYGAFTTLRKEGLIEKVREEDRRKIYALTAKGQMVLREQVRRLEILAQAGAAWAAHKR